MRDSFELEKGSIIDIQAQDNYSSSLPLNAADNLPVQFAGSVKNAAGDVAIANAYVAVYDENDDFFLGSYADENGNFSIPFVSAVTAYKAVASAAGFVPSAPFTLTISDEDIIHDFTLNALTDEDKVVYGQVFLDDGTTPVEGARIDLIDENEAVVASTMSIADGEYAVPYLSYGDYTMTVTKAGYNAARENITLIAGTSLVQRNVLLSVHDVPSGSTVSGYITNEDGGAPIANAWVGLYSTTGDALEKTTTTNSEGYYCFENVLNGTYYIKSKAVVQ